ncbi:MAG: class I SAM-dependent methyltransferase [Thermoplasmata archaeon]
MTARRSGTKSPQVPYSLTARVYDAIYAWKDYAAEARRIRAIVRSDGPPRAKTLLDVACGTGEHLTYLSRWYACTGLDVNERMLRIARRKLPEVRFVRGRMQRFELGRQFDVVTCLFSAIGYVRSERELRQTFRNLAAHLRPGGVAIVEPWLTPSAYRTRHIHLGTYGSKEFPIARMNIAARRGSRSIMDMHHLVGTPRGVLHWVERHDMGLFDTRTDLNAFRSAGFRARYVRKGFMKDRGLYVAVRGSG